MQQIPAGWYRIPDDPSHVLYWDGQQWSGEPQPAPSDYVDPAGVGAPPGAEAGDSVAASVTPRQVTQPVPDAPALASEPDDGGGGRNWVRLAAVAGAAAVIVLALLVWVAGGDDGDDEQGVQIPSGDEEPSEDDEGGGDQDTANGYDEAPSPFDDLESVCGHWSVLSEAVSDGRADAEAADALDELRAYFPPVGLGHPVDGLVADAAGELRDGVPVSELDDASRAATTGVHATFEVLCAGS